MCIRDRTEGAEIAKKYTDWITDERRIGMASELSLIHISEPTRLLSISYAVFCLKKKPRPPTSTRVRSSAASDVYKRQDRGRRDREEVHGLDHRRAADRDGLRAVSYTHLRAHETPEHLVCRLLLEKKTATTDIYTRKIVGSVRCV